MLKDIDAVIFDLDGTLVDSMWVWSAVDDIYLAKYNATKPHDFHVIMEGMSYTEVAAYFKEEFKIPRTIEEIKGDWLEMTMEMYRNKVKLKEGALEMLKHLHVNGIKMGIATSNARPLLDAVLEGCNMKDFFQVTCTACEVNAGKPAPDVYLKVAKDLGVLPSRCLVFEDVANGILAGKNAGMKVSAVEDEGNVTQRDYLRTLADYYIRTYKDVLKNTYEVL